MAFLLLLLPRGGTSALAEVQSNLHGAELQVWGLVTDYRHTKRGYGRTEAKLIKPSSDTD